VIDLDVHQGDGTALIFADDPHVITLSLHGKNNFPFRKQASTIDVELADGTGDEEYLSALEGVLGRVFDFQPQAIFYQSGVDALAADSLGKLSLTQAGLLQRDRLVMSAAHAYGAPFVITLGGGYAVPIEPTARAHANTFRTAAAVWDGARFPDKSEAL
jgi:acetoin utilization deacetylase AcuC-like enzyme